MTQSDRGSRFEAMLLRPAEPGNDAPWAFVILPREASAKLPRRGRTTVDGCINGVPFRAMLEPDGQLSHWIRIDEPLLKAASSDYGQVARFEITPVEQEPEPETPRDLQEALAASPAARSAWEETTTIARLDWIHWITSSRQAKTRASRVQGTCDRLTSGKRRVCCFDPSGYYSKAFAAPRSED